MEVGEKDPVAAEQGIAAKATKVLLDSVQVQKLLPHRYPFLLIDKVIEIEDNKRIVAIKNVTSNEDFFNGHFPGRPVMPGVLILEALAQAGAILARASSEGIPADKLIFLVGATDVKWKKQVLPGDTMTIELEAVKKRRPLWIMKGTASVDGKVVAQATITAAEA